MAARGLEVHAGLRQLAGVLAYALRARHGPLAIPPARRSGRADREPRARQRGAGAAAGAPDARFAVARCGLRHRAHRQVAPRLSAEVRAAEERLRRVLRPARGRRRLLFALRFGRDARPLRGRPGGAARRLPHRPAFRARRVLRAQAEGKAVPPVAALHRAALAVGNARGRSRIAPHRRAHRPSRRRLGRDLPRDGPADGRRASDGCSLPWTTSARPATPSSSSRATTAASATRTAGRSRAARWICSKAGSACRTSRAGPRACAPGETTGRLAITMDWVATFLAAAGVDPHADYPLDGIDLLGRGKRREACTGA